MVNKTWKKLAKLQQSNNIPAYNKLAIKFRYENPKSYYEQIAWENKLYKKFEARNNSLSNQTIAKRFSKSKDKFKIKSGGRLENDYNFMRLSLTLEDFKKYIKRL